MAIQEKLRRGAPQDAFDLTVGGAGAGVRLKVEAPDAVVLELDAGVRLHPSQCIALAAALKVAAARARALGNVF